MIAEIHNIIRSACVGQLSSIPLAFLAGAIQGSSLATIAATITNPATIAVFSMAGVAGYLVRKIYKQLEQWESEKIERQQELATEAVINRAWDLAVNETKFKRNKKVVNIADYRRARG